MSARRHVRGALAMAIGAATAMLACMAPAPAVEDAGGGPAPVDQIEQRLAKIEKIVSDVVAGRSELRAGMKQLLAKQKMSADEAGKLCESVSDQSKVIVLVGGQIALLERAENQKAMSDKQRRRLAKVRATFDETPPKMDCSVS